MFLFRGLQKRYKPLKGLAFNKLKPDFSNEVCDYMTQQLLGEFGGCFNDLDKGKTFSLTF